MEEAAIETGASTAEAAGGWRFRDQPTPTKEEASKKSLKIIASHPKLDKSSAAKGFAYLMAVWGTDDEDIERTAEALSAEELDLRDADLRRLTALLTGSPDYFEERFYKGKGEQYYEDYFDGLSERMTEIRHPELRQITEAAAHRGEFQKELAEKEQFLAELEKHNQSLEAEMARLGMELKYSERTAGLESAYKDEIGRKNVEIAELRKDQEAAAALAEKDALIADLRNQLADAYVRGDRASELEEELKALKERAAKGESKPPHTDRGGEGRSRAAVETAPSKRGRADGPIARMKKRREKAKLEAGLKKVLTKTAFDKEQRAIVLAAMDAAAEGIISADYAIGIADPRVPAENMLVYLRAGCRGEEDRFKEMEEKINGRKNDA